MQDTLDKAGKSYWDQVWDGRSVPDPVRPRLDGLGNYVVRHFHDYFVHSFSNQKTEGRNLLEIGCGRSAWLPYFAEEFGFRVSGIDYSEIGCDQASMILEKAGVKGRVICADFFAPPPDLIEVFDVVVSFGVVEHFEDTAVSLSSISKFLKPGGLIVTIVPNMAGWLGWLQKRADRHIYDIHVPLDRQALLVAHQRAALSVQSCEYLMSINLSVLNIEDRDRGYLYNVVNRWKARLSKLVWLLEQTGPRINPNRLTSPYVVCTARKLPPERIL